MADAAAPRRVSPARHLHEMPYNVDVLAHVTAPLTLEEEGVLHRAMRESWAAGHRGEAPGSLPNDDAALARILGTRKKTLIRVIRNYWFVDVGNSARLVWPWLRDLYVDARVRYDRRRFAATTKWQKRRDEPRCNASALHVQPDSFSKEKERAAGAFAATAPPPLDVPDPPPFAVDRPAEVALARAWVETHGAREEIEAEADRRCEPLLPAARGHPDSVRAMATKIFAGVRARHVEELLLEAYRQAHPILPEVRQRAGPGVDRVQTEPCLVLR